MATMTISILFFIFLCNLASGSSGATHKQKCFGEVTWSQAENCCSMIKGNLGSVGNESKMNQVLEYMRLHNMTSSWVNLRRRDMNKWKWIDGESGGFLQVSRSNGSCVWFNQETQRLEPGRCSDTTVGSLCQIKDAICKEFHRIAIGRQHNGICYLHFCGGLTWHEARAYCHTWGLGYTMALVKHRDTMEELARHKWSCDRFWVGLRKEEWLGNNDTPVDVIYKKWNPDETKDVGRCGHVRMQESSLLFEPKSCHAVASYVCLNLHDTNVKPLGMTTYYTTVIVGCSIGGFAALTGISAAMFLWRRKRNAGQRTRQQSKAEDDVNVPLQNIGAGEAAQGPNRYRLQLLLADTLLKMYDKIDLWSWHDKRVTVPMDEIYVDLVWVNTKHGIHGKKYQRLASYTEMFTKSNQGQRGQLIFLSGEPGVGKSTISRRICVDWSNIILDKKIMATEQRDVLGKFKYVVPIILRDVEDRKDLIEVIKEQLMLEITDAHALCKLITDDHLSTLFVIDGYDEYREKTSHDITSLLQRELFPYANVFITSRHSSDSHFTGQKNLPETEVLLRGFSREGVKEYVRKSFNKTTGKGEELQRKIETSEDLINLSRYPAVLLLMCCLWEETNQLATTIAGFYQDFVKYSCCRFERKYILATERHSHADIILHYCTNLMRIGEIATDGMTGERLELTFPSEKAKHLNELTWKLGFLKEETSTKGETRISFVHKTVQEWFVAYYIVNSEKSKQEELLIHFCSSPRAFRESSMIVTFSAALGGRDIVDQMETIIRGEDDMWKMQTALQLTYLSEHKGVDLVLPEVIELDITDKYPANVYAEYLSMNASKLVELTLTSNVERHMRLLQYLNAPLLTRLSLSASMIGAPYSVQKSHLTQGLDVTLVKFPLQTLKVERFAGLGRGMMPVEDDEYDDLATSASGDDKTFFDLLAVIRTLPQLPTLTELEFKFCYLGGVTLRALTECLPNAHLITLTITDCTIRPPEVMSVVEKLPECGKLKNFLIEDALDDNMLQLIDYTEKLANLQTLQLLNTRSGSGVSDNVRKKIKQTLAEKCPNLEVRM